MENYRFDKRSKSQFIKDIRTSHIAENSIALRIGQFVFNETGKWPTIVPNGCDYSGGFLPNKAVNQSPDYLIDGKLVEITRSKNLCNRVFHEKCSKMKKCIENKSSLVFVDGFEASKTPRYLMLSPSEINTYSKKAEEKYGITGHPTKNGMISKDSFRYDLVWFSSRMWKTLPILSDKAKLQYKDLSIDQGKNTSH